MAAADVAGRTARRLRRIGIGAAVASSAAALYAVGFAAGQPGSRAAPDAPRRAAPAGDAPAIVSLRKVARIPSLREPGGEGNASSPAVARAAASPVVGPAASRPAASGSAAATAGRSGGSGAKSPTTNPTATEPTATEPKPVRRTSTE